MACVNVSQLRAHFLPRHPYFCSTSLPPDSIEKAQHGSRKRSASYANLARLKVIMSSHGQSEALTLATRAIAMRNGTLVEDSGPNGNARAIIEREAAPIAGIWESAQ